jgi:hypothetical protein
MRKEEVRLREVRKELVAAAAEGRTVCYGHLMKKFGIPRGHPRGKGIASVIGAVDDMQRKKGAPGFASLVVRKDTGYPGGGFFCSADIPGRLRRPRSEGSNPRLTNAEKKYVDTLRKKAWVYYTRRHHG